MVSSEIPGWPAQRLVDGEFHRAWSSRPHGEHLASTEWAALILDGEQAINGLRLWPRTTGASPLALGFPKDLVVQYARETTEQTCNPASSAFARPENWRPLTTRYGLDQPGATWVPFDFGMVTAACVRVLAVSLSQDGYGLRYLQLAEMETLQNGVTIRPAQVAVSSEIPSWPSSRLGDGDRSTVWSSRVHGEFLDSTEWAAILLPSPQVIDALRVTPRVDQATGVTALGFPQDFVVQYAASGGTQTCDPTSPAFGRPENWRPLVMRYGYAQPSARPEVFAFSPVTAECVRLFGTELSSDDYGIRYLQLAEIEALRRDVASQ